MYLKHILTRHNIHQLFIDSQNGRHICPVRAAVVLRKGKGGVPNLTSTLCL